MWVWKENLFFIFFFFFFDILTLTEPKNGVGFLTELLAMKRKYYGKKICF